MTERFMTAIFCDDIREEVNNKMSLIGCYDAELIVKAMPINLPKLCVYMTVVTPMNCPFKSLTFRLWRDEELLREIPIPRDVMATLRKTAQKGAPPDSTRLQFTCAAILAPFGIQSPAKLQVSVKTESEELKGPGLRIRLAHDVAQGKRVLVGAASPRRRVKAITRKA